MTPSVVIVTTPIGPLALTVVPPGAQRVEAHPVARLRLHGLVVVDVRLNRLRHDLPSRRWLIGGELRDRRVAVAERHDVRRAARLKVSADGFASDAPFAGASPNRARDAISDPLYLNPPRPAFSGLCIPFSKNCSQTRAHGRSKRSRTL
jgi:hypothetical protein